MTLPLRRHDSLDSTNDEARRLAEAGERGPLWIVAREQTSGRGRRGRAWASQSGNLFATYLTAISEPLARCAQLSFAAGLAVGETVTHFVPAARVTLKWPNDVLLEGRKAAGILLESSGVPWPWLAVGIGVNLAHHPANVEFPAISLTAITGTAPDAEQVLAHLGKAWDAWYGTWRSQGFGPIRDAWLTRAAGIGQRIGVRLASREVEGIFETLDEDGALILRQPDGAQMRIAAGEVFFPS